MSFLQSDDMDELRELIRNRVFIMSRAKLSIAEAMSFADDEVSDIANFLRSEFDEEKFPDEL